MNNFLTLYGYELKKIVKRRIVINTLAVLALVVIYANIGGTLNSAYSWTDNEGNVIKMNGFEWLADQKEKTRELNGQVIDDALLEKVKEAYKNVYREEYQGEVGSGYRSMTVVNDKGEEESDEEIKETVRNQELYNPIYAYIRKLTGFYDAVHMIREETLYESRQYNLLEQEWAFLYLTESERMYWTERENKVSKPFTYGYAKGWDEMLDSFMYANLMLILAIVICLSSVFADEHLKRTDQLILCSRHGKGRLFFAKTAASITFGAVCSVFMFIVFLLSALLVYGTEGSDIVIQICRPLCSRSLTMGQAAFLMGGIYIVLGIVYSILTIFLSEAVKSAIAVIGIMVGSMLFTMAYQIPYAHRMASQIYNLLPTRILNVEQLWDGRLVSAFGLHLTNYQTAIILYVAAGVLLIWKGNRIWQKLEN